LSDFKAHGFLKAANVKRFCSGKGTQLPFIDPVEQIEILRLPRGVQRTLRIECDHRGEVCPLSYGHHPSGTRAMRKPS
jgi:hypothetical protein